MKSRNLYTFAETEIGMEDFRLKVFITLVREGSFTKAASALGVTQPAVSQHIAELEKITGVKLFVRTRGEAVLTDQGRVFLDYAERILSGYESMSVMFSSLQTERVGISVSEELFTYFVSPLLDSFVKVHPGVTFERVRFEEADLTISLAPSPDSPYDIYPETIAKLRVSLSPAPKKVGDFAATHESLSYFDVLFRPSAGFASTKLCRVLKSYFASLL